MAVEEGDLALAINVTVDKIEGDRLFNNGLVEGIEEFTTNLGGMGIGATLSVITLDDRDDDFAIIIKNLGKIDFTRHRLVPPC